VPTTQLSQAGLGSESSSKVPAGSQAKIQPGIMTEESPWFNPSLEPLPESVYDTKSGRHRISYPRPWDYTPRQDGGLVCPPKSSAQSAKHPFPEQAPSTTPLKGRIWNEHVLKCEIQLSTCQAPSETNPTTQDGNYGSMPVFGSSHQQDKDADIILPCPNLPSTQEAIQA
jgi:hypothetical protein